MKKRFELPLPPALNRCYRAHVSNRGRPYTYKTTEAKRWQRDARMLIYSQTKDRKKFTDSVRVAVELYLKRDRDIDSSFKLLLDTLEYANIIDNDRQIVELITKKVYPFKEESKIVVEIDNDLDSRNAPSST